MARSGTASRSSSSGKRSEEHTSELQSIAYLVCRLLLEKKIEQKHGEKTEKLTKLIVMALRSFAFRAILPQGFASTCIPDIQHRDCIIKTSPASRPRTRR